MACRGFWECLLKLLNFLLILVGLAMIGYGVYLFVGYRNAATNEDDAAISPSSGEFVQLGRPMLLAVSLADSIFDKLPKAWFIYLFTGIGAMVLFIACCGCIGTATRNGCCLTCVAKFENITVDTCFKLCPEKVQHTPEIASLKEARKRLIEVELKRVRRVHYEQEANDQSRDYEATNYREILDRATVA